MGNLFNFSNQNMKFLTLAALIAVAYAQDEEAKEGEGEAEELLEQGADCSEGKCGEGLCCGTATEVLEEGAEGEAGKKTVCNAADAAEFIDEEDPDIKYGFACNTEG